MVSETVKQVLSAESDANKLLAETRIKCSKIVEDAEKYADFICNEKTKAAEKAGAELCAENKLRAEQYRCAIVKECEKKKVAIRQMADRNMDSAVQVIIGQLFG